jgi:beta-lactamase class A
MKQLIFTILFISLTLCSFAQIDSLRQKIAQIIATKNATVGVAIDNFENGDTLSINNDVHYPMQSVFKLPIALAVLNEVDNGKLSLNQKILIKKADLLPGFWSPLRDTYPNGNIKLPLYKIIEYTVGQSDNNGCDILLRLIGGPATVNDYIHKIGIKDINIEVSEEEMHKEWNVQFRNWATPTAATALLRKFFDGNILSKKSFNFLYKTILSTSTGPNRIKGELPQNTLVAHKTGTSDTKDGITAAINDIGIITLPNGSHFAISVFVSNSKEKTEDNEKIIADVSKAAWDYFTNKLK